MILGLGAVFLREPVTRRLLFVMLVGLVGVGLVADAGGGLGGTNSDAIGTLLLLLAVLCCAFYTVFSRKLSARVDALFMVAVQQTVGLGWAFALLLVHTSYSAPFDLGKMSLELIGAASLSGLLYYAAAYWLYITALRSVPAAVAGSYFNVIPVFGVVLAFLFLGETLASIQWAGAAAILASVLSWYG